MIFNFVIEFLIINNYRNILVFINVISLCEKIHKAIRIYDVIIVLSYLSIMISIRLRDKCKAKLSRDCDFMFMLIKLFNRFELNKDVLNHIIDTNMCAIQVNNVINKFVIIEKNFYLNTIRKYKKKESYIVFFYYDYLVVNFDSKS